MLYEPPKTKRYILIGASVLVLAVLALVFWSAWKMKTKPVDALPVGVQKTNQEKQKEMLDAIKKANTPVAPSEQAKRQQEMTEAVNKTNENKEPLPPSEQEKQVQDMLNAINAASRK